MFLNKNIAQKNKIILQLISFFSFVFLVIHAHAADITVSPANGSFSAGKTFTVDVYVSNNTEAINAVSGTISYPTDLLSIKSFSKSGSIVTLWPEEPAYSNANGTFKFEGAILNPGFSGSKGKVVTITFTAKAEGSAALSFSDGQVLANDGQATNIVNKLSGATYAITDAITAPTPAPNTPSTPGQLALTITSSSYPDQNTWYNSKDATFSWNVPGSVTSVRTLYSSEPFSVPTKVYTPPVSGKTFTVDEDGVQYMHVQAKDNSGWGAVAHYKFQIDTEAPTDVAISFPEGDTTANPNTPIKVSAYDPLSGLSSVDIVIDGAATTTYPISASGVYTLKGMLPGSHAGIAYVRDKAGNIASAKFAFAVTEIKAPEITEYTKHAIVGDVLKVSGTTYPNSSVEVSYTNTKNDKTYSKNVASDSDGTFLLLWTDDLPSGVYEMKARSIDAHGATGAYSEPRTLNLEQQPYIQFGLFVMNWLSLALLGIIAVVCILATLWYSLTQFGRWRRKVHRVMKEAESTLKTNVQALRRDLEEFHTLLVKTQKKRELTKEETAILKKFEKRLEITEKEIEEKLEQIG
jgi:hypothetical protein